MAIYPITLNTRSHGEHHPIDPPPAQRTPPVGVPQTGGAGHAETAVAAGEEHGIGPSVDARVAQVRAEERR